MDILRYGLLLLARNRGHLLGSEHESIVSILLSLSNELNCFKLPR